MAILLPYLQAEAVSRDRWSGLVHVLGDVGRAGGFVMENDGKVTLLQARRWRAEQLALPARVVPGF